MGGNRKYGFMRGNRGGFSQHWFCAGCGKLHAVTVWIEYEKGANKYCAKSKPKLKGNQMKNETKHPYGKAGTNHTPFRHVRVAQSLELVNEYNTAICSFEIDDVPKVINQGNAQRFERIVNSHAELVLACDAIAKDLETFQSDDANHLTVELVAEHINRLNAAIAKAKGTP